MFERYTEKARRIFFFARYEASLLGSDYVEPEHLLLGLLREDKAICTRFVGPLEEVESIRAQIENAANRGERRSSSVDIPLSKASKSVLAQAEAERERLGISDLGTEHIFLGLLHQESLAARILRERGVKAESAREKMAKPVTSPTEKKPRTACRDCRHLIVDGEPNQSRLNLFCAASPKQPAFDCYTGEVRHGAADRPGDRFRVCINVNFGQCPLFEPNPESQELRPSA